MIGFSFPLRALRDLSLGRLFWAALSFFLLTFQRVKFTIGFQVQSLN
jgi:hypothetical protein